MFDRRRHSVWKVPGVRRTPSVEALTSVFGEHTLEEGVSFLTRKSLLLNKSFFGASPFSSLICISVCKKEEFFLQIGEDIGVISMETGGFAFSFLFLSTVTNLEHKSTVFVDVVV